MAKSFQKIDPAIVGWLKDAGSGTPDKVRAEALVDQLETILKGTTLDAFSLSKIGLALGRLPSKRSIDEVAASRFLLAAIATAESELAARKPPDPTVKPLLSILWEVALYWNDTAFEHKRRIYPMLIRWEPPGSARHFRARFKYSAALLGCDEHGAALRELDALESDVRNGVYSGTDPYLLAELRWRIYHQSGRSAEGLAMLRDASGRCKDPSAASKISALLIVQLANAGHVAEAQARYAAWKSDESITPEGRGFVESFLAGRQK